MKKIYLVIISIIFISIIFIIFIPPKINIVEIAVLESTAVDYDIHDLRVDAVREKNIKKVEIIVAIKNYSIRNIQDINLSFSKDTHIAKPLILSERIDTELPWTVVNKKFSQQTEKYYFLIDGTDMSDKNIKEYLKGLKLDVTSTTIHNNNRQTKKITELEIA